MAEADVFRVTAQADVSKSAGAVAHYMRDGHETATIQALGGRATYNALKVAIDAASMLKRRDGVHIFCRPALVTKETDEGPITVSQIELCRGEFQPGDLTVYPVSKATRAPALAGAVAHRFRENPEGQVALDAIGARAAFAAFRALVYANRMLEQEGLSLYFKPYIRRQRQADGTRISSARLIVAAK